MQYLERTIYSLDWVILLLVGSIAIIAILKSLYPNRFDDFIKLPFSSNYFLLKGKSEEIKHPFSWVLFGVQIISISLFLNLFFIEENLGDSKVFLQIFLGISSFVIIKYSIEKIIGIVFSIENITNQYAYQKLTYRNYLALFLLIANFIFYFSVQANKQVLLVFAGILILINCVVLYYSFKKYRNLLFSNFFYFLLYLCTLEISPYVLLYKVLV
ncbi:MAG: DUF4271 domain-containing protein [Flavobacteriaceae bacterium]|nr:DUF4271 domain-containing protein [Flavobacteriaceae bacterium]